MSAYPITGAYASAESPVTPYTYGGGAVWVIAFSDLADRNSSAPSYIRAFKSTDSGQTWNTAGGGTKEVLTHLGPDPEFFRTTRVITREHPDWPSQPYLYALYCTPNEQLHISRYNVLTELWDLESTGDLDVVGSLPGGFAQGQLWSFDFTGGSPGDGGILYQDKDGYQHTNLNYYARVAYAAVDRDTLSIDTPVRVDGQPDDDIVFAPGDVRRGVNGCLHGFASQSDPENVLPATTYQSVLRFVGAGPGAPSLSELGAGALGYPYSAQVEQRAGNTYVYVLTSSANQALYVGQSTTAGITFTELFDTAGDTVSAWPLSTAPNADTYRAWPVPADQLERQSYDGVSLGSLDLVYDVGSEIGTVGAGAFTGGSACVFSLTATFPVAAQPCYFVGVAPLQLLGGEGIKSEEAFGRAHGITGGGPPVTCGEPVIVPPQPGCSPVPVTPIPDGQEGQCDTLGFSY